MTEIMTLHEPKGWRLYRLGQLFDERKEKVSDKDFSPLSVTMNGIVPQLDTAAKTDDGDNRKLVKTGDYVINSRSDRKGSGGISEHDGSVSLISIVLKPKGVYPRFAHHLLRSRAFQEEFYRWGHGIVADLWTTRYADMKNIRLFLPDFPTQTAIADFLDRETARIDQLIEKKQRLLDRMAERETATLDALFSKTQAKRWRIRHLGRLKNGAGFPVELQGDPDQDIAFFKVKHLKTFGLDAMITETDDTVSSEIARQLRATVFPSGTIVFAKIGAALLLGRFSMIGRPACLDNNMAAYVPNPRLIDSHFCLLALSRIDMATMVQPGAVPSLSTEAFNNYDLPLPPLEAQRELVREFRGQRTALAAVSSATATSIDRLHEFRAALITAAVTGQIDVATWSKRGSVDRRLEEIQEAMRA